MDKWDKDGFPVDSSVKVCWAWDYDLQRHIRVPGFNVHRGGCVTSDD